MAWAQVQEQKYLEPMRAPSQLVFEGHLARQVPETSPFRSDASCEVNSVVRGSSRSAGARPQTAKDGDHLGALDPTQNPAVETRWIAVNVSLNALLWRTAMPTATNHPAPAQLRTPDLLFLRLPTVVRITGLGRSTIYRLIAEQKFPSPVRLGARAVAWRHSDLEEWSESRTAVSH